MNNGDQSTPSAPAEPLLEATQPRQRPQPPNLRRLEEEFGLLDDAAIAQIDAMANDAFYALAPPPPAPEAAVADPIEEEAVWESSDEEVGALMTHRVVIIHRAADREAARDSFEKQPRQGIEVNTA